MLARGSRVAQSFELIACLAAALWLHAARGWGPGAMAALVIGWVAGSRLALVAASSLVAWVWRTPRLPEQRIGLLGGAELFLREYRAFLAFNLGHLPWEALLLRPDPAPVPTQRVPVLLVHGYFANRGYFRALVRRLEARGVGPIFAPNFRSWLAPIETFADELHAELERIAAGTGQPRAVVIAHSMGGLAARACIARHGPGRIARLITVGSPHHGTVLATMAVGRNARQMEPGSAFLAALEAAEASAGGRVETLSVWTPHDNLVAPQASSRLSWARNVAVPGYGHIGLVESRALVEVLVPELESAGVKVAP